MSDTPPVGSGGWWQADDGKWYPPEARPDFTVWKYGSATRPTKYWWMGADGRWWPPRPRKPSAMGRWYSDLTPVERGLVIAGLVVTAVAVFIGLAVFDEQNISDAEYSTALERCRTELLLSSDPSFDDYFQLDRCLARELEISVAELRELPQH